MALKATIFKAELIINDMDRHYYNTHELRLARHPSESDERMMLRLLAFATYASDQLEFGKGLSSDDEPDLWAKDLAGNIEYWIDLGQPSEKRINKACGRAQRVVVINYGGGSGDIWWQQNEDRLGRYTNLCVLSVDISKSLALADLVSRNMQLQCNIQDNAIWIASGEQSVELVYERRR